MASDIPSPNTECFECGNIHNFLWCSICETEAFIQNFHRWTSGNTKIDKAIQYTQRHASHDVGNLEWIPFENIDFIELRARSAFSTIYGGTWLEGPRIWDQNNGGWLRNGPTKCALKTIENSNQMSQEYLDNIIRYHKCLQGRYVVDCFGVTRDQNGCYMFVMELCDENLYQYIDRISYLCWKDIVNILQEIIDGIKRIHNNRLYHGNLHGGNLLTENRSGNISIRISDIGLYGPVDKKTSAIYGVLPYIAPEVLNGNGYIQASDIYSFGMIMWTLSTYMRPFCHYSHDIDLATNICKEFRPEIIENTPEAYSTLMKKCWHQDPNERPNATELSDILNLWATETDDNNPISNLLNTENINWGRSEIIHPNAIYNGQLINFN